MRRYSAIFATIAVLIMTTAVAQASTVQFLSNDDLVAKSTSIVRGKVVSEIGMLRRSTIYTNYRIQILEVLKGTADSQIDVAVPGGVAQGIREIVSGAPKLMAGTEYVLFLWTSQSGLTQIIGLSQGLFLSVQEPDGTQIAVRAGGSAATLVNPATGRTVTDDGSRMSIGDIRKRVRALPRVGAAK